MEITKVEVQAVEGAVLLDSHQELVELSQLDLALIGGGTGAISLG